jgi:DNA-binding NarL/FixJ family response regulator
MSAFQTILTDPEGNRLPPRQQQVMDGLIRGLTERQLALRLGISRHTVHDYVKSIYARFGVCSRAELLSVLIQSLQQALERSGVHASGFFAAPAADYPQIRKAV